MPGRAGASDFETGGGGIALLGAPPPQFRVGTGSVFVTGVAPAQFAIAWCLKNPHVSTVMLGASKTAQLKENLQALTVLDKLDADVMQRVDAVLKAG